MYQGILRQTRLQKFSDQLRFPKFLEYSFPLNEFFNTFFWWGSNEFEIFVSQLLPSSTSDQASWDLPYYHFTPPPTQPIKLKFGV